MITLVVSGRSSSYNSSRFSVTPGRIAPEDSDVISSKLSKTLAWGVLSLGLTASISALALTEAQKSAIAERLAPAGKLCLQGDASCGAAAPVASGGAARSGEDVYNTACMACHTTGVAGSPMIGDAAAWDERLAKGIDTLHTHAIEGFNAMPAKGACMTCSNDEVIAAVDYMLEKSQ